LLGHPFANINFFNIPINEIFLLICLSLIVPDLKGLLISFKKTQFLVLWSFFFSFLAVLDFFKNGLWAFRDATHLFHIWWIFVCLSYFNSTHNIISFMSLLFTIIAIIVPIKIFMIAHTDFLSEIIFIEGINKKIDLLTGKHASIILPLLLIFYWYFINSKNIKSFFYMIIIFLVQSRALVFGFLISLIPLSN